MRRIKSAFATHWTDSSYETNTVVSFSISKSRHEALLFLTDSRTTCRHPLSEFLWISFRILTFCHFVFVFLFAFVSAYIFVFVFLWILKTTFVDSFGSLLWSDIITLMSNDQRVWTLSLRRLQFSKRLECTIEWTSTTTIRIPAALSRIWESRLLPRTSLRRSTLGDTGIAQQVGQTRIAVNTSSEQFSVKSDAEGEGTWTFLTFPPQTQCFNDYQIPDWHEEDW